MNYTKQKQALSNLEWERAMKDMGVSQTISNEELGQQRALKHEMEGFL